jgi:ElaB/YqjD/DUF883 family membrane-anchored ribosome-binding protein
MKIRKFGFKKWFPVYGDEGAGSGGAGDGGTGAGAGSGAGAGAGEPEKKFTQKDLDFHINKRFKEEKAEKEKLVSQLTRLQESKGLTEAEKAELQEQIDGLNNAMQTKEQQAQNEIKTLKSKHEKEFGSVKQEAETWRNRFTSATIERAIADAAITTEAEDANQLIMMFAGQTRLVENVDENTGKGTGTFTPKLQFTGINPETKKPEKFDLPVAEAISTMKEQGLHKNLFKHGAKSGTGTSAGGKSGGGKDPSKMPNPADYASNEEFAQAYQKYRDSYNPDGTKRAQ